MAEKVIDNVNGLHVSVGNVFAWKTIFKLAAAEDNIDLWNKLYMGIKKPLSYQQCATEHLQLLTGNNDV
jgi:hypothetical protein